MNLQIFRKSHPNVSKSCQKAQPPQTNSIIKKGHGTVLEPWISLPEAKKVTQARKTKGTPQKTLQFEKLPLTTYRKLPLKTHKKPSKAQTWGTKTPLNNKTKPKGRQLASTHPHRHLAFSCNVSMMVGIKNPVRVKVESWRETLVVTK